MGRKLGSCASLGEVELDPHLTQCRLGWGLPPYQVVSWCIQPFGHNRHGPKVGVCPFWAGEAGTPWNTMSLLPKPTCTSHLFLIHPTVWPQYTNVSDRQDRQTTVRLDRAKVVDFCKLELNFPLVTIRCDTIHYLLVPKSWRTASLICRTETTW